MARLNAFKNLSLEDRILPTRNSTNGDSKNASSTAIDDPTIAFYKHSTGQRTNTDAVIASTIRAAHPSMSLTIVPREGADLLAYAQGTDKASYRTIVDPADPNTNPLIWRSYAPPASRVDGDTGFLVSDLKFGKFTYTHGNNEYILYVADCRDGAQPYPILINQYLMHGQAVEVQTEVDALIRDAGRWSNTLHDEIWVFDGGYWQKSADLFRSISRSRWEDVIMEEEEKSTLRADVARFYDQRQRYEKYRIAWKRGVIYYGPPGNGKTISIKALSNELYHRKEPVPTLYVRSLSSFGGPEYSVRMIFEKARAEAPCLLVFEDLDSMVTDQVRSYFLNEVDGLTSNSGVYMLGSTNHIERLDPGISKRPSRFDRKFEFPKPNEEQRIIYCEFWRHKLRDTEEAEDDADVDADIDDLVHVDAEEGIDFPKELSPEIARITDKFSFAYMQEAFVATLMTLASGDASSQSPLSSGGGDKKDKFDHLLFWRVIKKQVALLREQL